MHTGDNAAVLGAKGGRRRTIRNPDNLASFDPPQSAADLRALIGDTIIAVRSGRLDPKVANSISILASSFLAAEELADLTLRLAALEGSELPRPAAAVRLIGDDEVVTEITQ